MEQLSVGNTVADLREAVAIQAEVAHDRLALEWGHIVVTRLLKVWKQLEAQDALAYEDKVAAQVHVLEEATSSLWHIHLPGICRVSQARAEVVGVGAISLQLRPRVRSVAELGG